MSAPPHPTRIAEAEADRRLAAKNNDVEALIAKADARFNAAAYRAANAYYRAAVTHAAAPSAAFSAGLKRDIARAHNMMAQLAQMFRDHLLSALEADGFGADARHPRFQASLDMMLGVRERSAEYRAFPQTPLVYYYPDMPHVEFANAADFAWVSPLEALYPQMRTEAEALLADHDSFRPYVKGNANRPSADFHGMLENPDWSTFFLFENGAPVDVHIARCPTIYKAVTDYVPLCRITTRAPSVMLSLLKPGARIPPHTGMLNPRFICHLPLIVPNACGFRVGGTTRSWEEGKVLLFDDTVEHEAWNESIYDRLVLIFDIWRPEVTAEEQAQIVSLFAAVDQYSE
jgi:aspartyl/asparaginyl beta-hydroxylase (cupin superfamily)